MTKVIKIGGSLAKNGKLKKCLAGLDQCFQDDLVIVPGGGEFADTVRKVQQYWRFDERSAHEMALLAMQQMALLIKAMQPEWLIVSTTKQSVPEAGRRLIWSPQIKELDKAGIPPGWQVTSDSLAAWLAGVINAKELLLVKSTPIELHSDLVSLQRKGVVDSALQDFLLPGCQLNVVFYQDILAKR